ncbi:acyl-CoA dehydrogenase family protein [Sphingosinicella terrae]|uniref:acyl-CoA dehydrogenase family protein n=1 Tax=Sphingosinicella terrae TaxID=2172047 RepID=UPI000E0D7501|nr:acyl-CoA dehydrogenase family protein [Sphingosinicella terrae]
MNNAHAFEYPDDIQALLTALGGFIRSEILPRHERHADLLSDSRRKYLPDGRFSPEVWELIAEVRKASAAAGFYGMSVPEEIGGGGMGLLAYFAAWEYISHTCGPREWLSYYIISHWAKGPSPLLARATEQARAEVLPGIMSGDQTMCFALSEPEAGSDAAMIRTRATPDGDGWRLTGNKIWISNSVHAEYATIFAVTDPELAAARKGGISAFLVPTDSPGFRLESTIKMWGQAGTVEGLLAFDDVRIEPWQLLGELHRGFALAMLGVGLGRMYNSARAVGYSRWALREAFDYVKVRETFGKKLSAYQGVTFPLAECAMQVHAAHLMSINVAQLLDRGLPATKELAMTKCFAAEMAKSTVDRVMQVFGAMGFTNEMFLTDAYIAMRKISVADGSSEIMRRQIAKHMLNGDMAL